MITYKGTTQQINLAKAAIAQVKFPFNLLPNFSISWGDLNSTVFRKKTGLIKSTGHEGNEHSHSHHDPNAIHPLEGMFNGREYILGVFYPSTGNIVIDRKLVNYPDLVNSTISAEVAHGVDQALLTTTKRNQIVSLLHPNGSDGHTWWEKSNYSTEYYTLVGETFMILFTKAYSDIPFGDTSDFTHQGESVTGQQVRDILGIQKPADVPTPPVQYVVFGKSKVYHLPSHYRGRQGRKIVNSTDGLIPCHICFK